MEEGTACMSFSAEIFLVRQHVIPHFILPLGCLSLIQADEVRDARMNFTLHHHQMLDLQEVLIH